MYIIKRNGAQDTFDYKKIVHAIEGANGDVPERNRLTSDQIEMIAKDIENSASESTHTFGVEEIQDLVEDHIWDLKKFKLGRAYSQYRFLQAEKRKKNSTDDSVLALVNYENEEIKQENSNKNPEVASVQRDYMAGEVSKDISKRYLIPDDIWKAHELGIIHFHDSDYFANRIHNCFTGSTKFVTDQGIKKFNQFNDGDEVTVKDKDGILRQATVHMYGNQKMNIVYIKNCKVEQKIHCTPNHRWVLKDGTVTTNLQVGDVLYYTVDSTSYDEEIITKEDAKLFALGFAIGDGCDHGNYTQVRLCGDKTSYAWIFELAGYTVSSPERLNGDKIALISGAFKQNFLNGEVWKFLDARSNSLIFKGYYAADGRTSEHSKRIETSDIRLVSFIKYASSLAGYYVSNDGEYTHNTVFKENAKLYYFNFFTKNTDHHHWKVEKIETYRAGEVPAYCVEEPVTHTFTLDKGIVTGNCDLVNLEDMLQNGTVISETMIEKPRSFSTACNIMTQIMAQVASSQYGGQSMTLSHIAPFVDISRQKIKSSRLADFDVEREEDLSEYDRVIYNRIVEHELHEEIKRGVQMIQYQVLTLMTTNGQTPFITLFMFINEVPEGQTRDDLALIIEEVLKQRIQGVKNEAGEWITPAFPKLIYALDDNNVTEDSEYFYLTKLAAKCTAKRMVPDYISAKKMREYKDGQVYPCMGCRSFLTSEPTVLNEDGTRKFYGRFNQGVVTINLVDVALSSGGDEDKFWSIYEERLELCHRALRVRHERLLGTPSDIAPIIWQNGGLARLKKGETIDNLLFGGYSTISLGYAGLYECVYAMKKKSHTDPDAMPFALKVMQKLNDKCKEWRDAENIAYSVYGTPIESTTYKFSKCLQKRFGIIEGVTDHNYITNSYHVNVREHINAFDKLAFEAPFQVLSPGGAISYIETPNLENNIELIITVMQYIYDNIIYAELNTKSDYCQVCGTHGEIKIIEEDGKLIWECPVCGNRDQNKMNVARRTCGYIGTQFWNQGRTQEILDRYIHLDNMEYEW